MATGKFDDSIFDVSAEHDATEIVFADDLNAFLAFDAQTPSEDVLGSLRNLQNACHDYGDANRVEFDATKEHFVILHRTQPMGDDFRLLGALYDCKLVMDNHCSACASQCRWMVHSLVKLRFFFPVHDLVRLYKAHVLPRLEAQTPSVYHASVTVLDNLDGVQRLFLRSVGLDDKTSLTEYNLAPLSARRDIAMLGLLHKCALREAPPQLLDLFPLAPTTPHPNTRLHARRHPLQLTNKAHGRRTAVFHRSLFGLVAVYNLLPPGAVTGDVKHLQSSLQYLLKRVASTNYDNTWQLVLSRPHLHTLQNLRLHSQVDSWGLPPRPPRPRQARHNRRGPRQRRTRNNDVTATTPTNPNEL